MARKIFKTLVTSVVTGSLVMGMCPVVASTADNDIKLGLSIYSTPFLVNK